MLAGSDLDVEWLKALVAKPRLRPIALRLLADHRLIEPPRVGLPWLLELARSSDGELAQFAQRMLLESFKPEDFSGVGQLWELATGKKQPGPCARSRRRISERIIPSSARGCPKRRRSAFSRDCGTRTSRSRRSARSCATIALTCAGSRSRSRAKRSCAGAIRISCTSLRGHRTRSRAGSRSSS